MKRANVTTLTTSNKETIMAIKEPKKQFDFVVHRNGYKENVAVFEESKWLAMAKMRTIYPGAKFDLVAGGRK